ncbi:MAG: PRTRC system protein C [Thermodesulfovibrionales bacterium]
MEKTGDLNQLPRKFVYNNMTLDDVSGTPEEALAFYADFYTDLSNGVVEGPEIKDGFMVYTFRKAVDTKGYTNGDALFELMAAVARALDDTGGWEPDEATEIPIEELGVI